MRSFGHCGALPVLAMLVDGWLSLRRHARTTTARPDAPAVWVASLAGIAYSADTSWRFAADYLDLAGTAERTAMFGAAGLVLFATALRRGMRREGAQ